MRIRWMSQASENLLAAHRYLDEENPRAADLQIKLILATAKNLSAFPEMGKPGRIRGSRELVVAGTPYILVYRIREDSIRIIAVLHAARRWPSTFKH